MVDGLIWLKLYKNQGMEKKRKYEWCKITICIYTNIYCNTLTHTTHTTYTTTTTNSKKGILQTLESGI